MTQRIVDTNGWFEIPRNPISRAGVFPYRGAGIQPSPETPCPIDADRIYQIYRPPEELADPACVESFRLVPWIDEHPSLTEHPSQLLGENATPAENVGIEGVIGENVGYDDATETLYGNIKAFSKNLSLLIASGKKQLSAGFRCIYDMTPGIINGVAYDGVQRKIRGNQLASVNRGRMGPSVAVLDHSEFMHFAIDTEDIQMADPTDDGGEGEITIAQLAAIVKAIGPQITALNEAMAALVAPPVADDDDAALDAATKPVAKPACSAPAAMDSAERVKIKRETLIELSQRNNMASQLAAHIGTFDHADMLLEDVAKYGAEKLKLTNVPSGQEVTAVNAYLAGAPKPGVKIALAMDSKNDSVVASAVDAYLAKGVA